MTTVIATTLETAQVAGPEEGSVGRLAGPPPKRTLGRLAAAECVATCLLGAIIGCRYRLWKVNLLHSAGTARAEPGIARSGG